MYLTIVAPLLASWALLALLGAALLLLALPFPAARRYVRESTGRGTLAAAWLVALVATSGSLYFSEVVGFVPCLLCWYQRIAMYPLVVVLGVAVLRRDSGVWRYALPLAAIGALISSYHTLIQYRPNLDVVTCSATVPCTARYLAVFGFVSIPVMAGAGFLAIAALMLAARTASARG